MLDQDCRPDQYQRNACGDFGEPPELLPDIAADQRSACRQDEGRAGMAMRGGARRIAVANMATAATLVPVVIVS